MFNQPLTHFTMEIVCHYPDYFGERSGKLYNAGWNAGSGLSKMFHGYLLLDYIHRLRMDGVIIDQGCLHSANRGGHF